MHEQRIVIEKKNTRIRHECGKKRKSNRKKNEIAAFLSIQINFWDACIANGKRFTGEMEMGEIRV